MSILVIVSYVLFSCINFSLSYNKEDNQFKSIAKIACVTFFQPKANIYKIVLFKVSKVFLHTFQSAVYIEDLTRVVFGEFNKFHMK